MLEKIRKTIEKYGIENVTTKELFTILLNNEQNANTICKYQNLTMILGKEQKELELLFNKDTALKLMVLKELMLRLNQKQCLKRYTTTEDIANYLIPRMQYKLQEEFIVISFDTKMHIISCDTISKGTYDQTLVDVRLIMLEAIKNRATSIIIAHNHPSGDPTPSKEDQEVTKKVKEATKTLSITFLDHMIIGNGCYYSFCEEEMEQNTEIKAKQEKTFVLKMSNSETAIIQSLLEKIIKFNKD